MRRGGVASVRIEGAGIDLDAKDAPAICGALYNADVKALNVKAGEGLLFETCLPEGTLQINADDRKPGAQALRSPRSPRGASVLFNQTAGLRFVMPSARENRIVVSPDLFKAEAQVTLRNVVGAEQVKVTLTIDCTQP